MNNCGLILQTILTKNAPNGLLSSGSANINNTPSLNASAPPDNRIFGERKMIQVLSKSYSNVDSVHYRITQE